LLILSAFITTQVIYGHGIVDFLIYESRGQAKTPA